LNPTLLIRRFGALAFVAAAFAAGGQASAFAAAAPSVGDVSVALTGDGTARASTTINGHGSPTSYRGIWGPGRGQWCASGDTASFWNVPTASTDLLPVDSGDHEVSIDFTGLPVGELICAGIEATNSSGTTLVQSWAFTPVASVQIPPADTVDANGLYLAAASRCFTTDPVSVSKSVKGRKYSLVGKRSPRGNALTFSLSAGSKPAAASYSLGGATLKPAAKTPWSVTIPETKVASHAWLTATVGAGKSQVTLRLRLTTTAC
jgi:hypothetical protein